MTEQPSANQIVIGVDTHDLVHVAVAVDHLGRRLSDLSIPTSPSGYEYFATWGFRSWRDHRGSDGGHRVLWACTLHTAAKSRCSRC